MSHLAMLVPKRLSCYWVWYPGMELWGFENCFTFMIQLISQTIISAADTFRAHSIESVSCEHFYCKETHFWLLSAKILNWKTLRSNPKKIKKSDALFLLNEPCQTIFVVTEQIGFEDSRLMCLGLVKGKVQHIFPPTVSIVIFFQLSKIDKVVTVQILILNSNLHEKQF